ncbi:MAG: transketolase C-terminal domain-containing protein [Acutalibacteraceae bacterium]
MAAGGSLPVFAVYSTFLQRGYDQIIHDVAIQNVKVIFAIDRAGIVGEDGETHQGVFDVAFLNTVPNLTVYSPAYYYELRMDLDAAVKECDGAVAVRYPRGKELYKPSDFQITGNSFDCYGDESAEHVIVTYGRIFSNACLALEELKSRGISVRIIKLNRIKPVDKAAVLEAAKAKHLYFFEEGIQQGGLADIFIFCCMILSLKGVIM